MKIQNIEIQNFRGFPCRYKFELNSKNLLLYGENGSGKSTLFHAVREFFDLEKQARPFRDQKNLFSTDTGGEIAITFSNDPDQPVSWTALTDRPLGDARVSQTALRTACLDYRAILQTSFTHQGDEVNLFDLLLNYLLANYSVTVSGGTTKTLSSLWQGVQAGIPSKNTQKQIGQIDELCDEFNNIIELHLPALEKEAERLLNYFPDCNVILHLKPQKVIYNRDEKKLDDQKILLEVDFNNTPIPAHQHILNEARLSAIALSIYLAGTKLSVPADVTGTPTSVKLLLLDDVVIGLDLSNRLPLLEILQKEFSDWQIILMTYDKVWFDMVRNWTTGWECQEIYTTQELIPVHKSKGDFLDKAREHLANNDDHAAAVYTRAEFERRLKNYCEKLHVKVGFKKQIKHIKADELFNQLRNTIEADPNWKSDSNWKKHYKPIFKDLSLSQKVILNPLSHSQLITIARPEIQSAIDAVFAFKLLPKK